MERKKYIAPSLLAANFTNLDSELNIYIMTLWTAILFQIFLLDLPF